ncbi:MAG: TolC family protein [Candidatus Omnitrophica bacterium]|nr:TolC family protein [Candidatus Omnitrophota bacterium]
MTIGIRISLFALLFLISSITPRVCCQEVARDNSIMELSLKDAVRIAYLNNNQIQIQEEEVEIAKANILAAQGNFMPIVNVGAGYTYNDSVLYSGKIREGNKDTRIFTGYKSDNVLNITVNESIFNGGANIANLAQAKLGLKVQQETLRARKLDVEFETKRLYYGVLLAYEAERIANDLVNRAKVHYDDVKNRFDQGAVSKFELLQSSVQVSKLIPDLVKARNDVELITAELKKLLSVDLDIPIWLRGKLYYSPVEIKEKEFLSEAYKNKPEMILKMLGINISKWAIEYAKAGYYPQVNATGNYSYRSNDVANMVNPRHDNWNIGATVTFMLFDGFSTTAKIKEAKAKYAESYLQKEDTVQQTAVDIKQACLDMAKSESIIKSQKDSVVEAKEALYISEIGYDNGVTTNLDVLTSQVSLGQVETYLAQGTYDYIMAKAQLYRTMGRESLEE